MLSSTSSSPGLRTQLLAKLRAEKDRRRNLAASRLSPYQSDPVGFVENELKGFLWSKQKEIAASVAAHRRTAVKSCHDVGKTFLAARIAAWWLSVFPPGEAFLVTSAPTFHQVRALLWREINKAHAAGNLPGRVNQTEWLFGNELVGFGRSPADTDPTSFQGIHARYVLVIFDEACGIAKPLWDAADSLIANDESHFLAIGNPDDPETEFANVCKPGSGWNVIRVNAFESPNLSGEEVPDFLRPLLIGKTWVEEKRKSWGEGSPLWISKVTGEFPKQSSDSLVPLTALREATLRRSAPGEPNELGVDVSRFGDDNTVIFHRRGDVARRLAKDHNRDLMHITGMVVQAIAETGAKRVKIDDIGLGGGVTDRLNEIKREKDSPLRFVEIIGVNVGEGAQEDQRFDKNAPPDERFINLRAELNWSLRERFISGNIALTQGVAGELDDLLSQAGQIKYKYTSRGKIQIEAKDEMKKRTQGVSPDDWDALVLCYAQIGSAPLLFSPEFAAEFAAATRRR